MYLYTCMCMSACVCAYYYYFKNQYNYYYYDYYYLSQCNIIITITITLMVSIILLRPPYMITKQPVAYNMLQAKCQSFEVTSSFEIDWNCNTCMWLCCRQKATYMYNTHGMILLPTTCCLVYGGLYYHYYCLSQCYCYGLLLYSIEVSLKCFHVLN